MLMLFSFSPSEDLPDEVRERWETFCASSLGETNKRNTVDLVGLQGSISMISVLLAFAHLFRRM